MFTERLYFQEMRAQNETTRLENGCGRGQKEDGREVGVQRRLQEAGQRWLAPDVRASCSGPEARSSDLLRFQDTERQSAEQPGPGPGPGMPADPGWLVALETASCSGQAPGWCNLGRPVTFLLASGPGLRGNREDRGT